MKAAALICEFNPFHNGHAYLIERIKELFPEKPVACFMSGEFVQRGEIAYIPAMERAQMAVLCGADAVFALPVEYSLAPAQIYAASIINLIEKTELCDTLVFGSESGELSELQLAADNMMGEDFERELKLFVEEKMTYPAARSAAYRKLFGSSAVIETPNNTLGIEYLRAVKKLTPVTFVRTSSENVSSAKAIRGMDVEAAEELMPKKAYSVLLSARERGLIYDESLGERNLLSLVARACGEFADVPADMAARIKKCALESSSLREYYEKLSVKQYTSARLRRMTLCTALNIEKAQQLRIPPYLRLLAANETGTALLSENKRGEGVAILTKPSRISEISSEAREHFEKNAERERVAFAFRQNMPPLSDAYRQTPFILR